MTLKIVVAGAGVSGLTTAVVLAEAGHDVSIVAREVEAPASLAAAAVWYPYHVGGAELDAWAEDTRAMLLELCGVAGSGVSLVDFSIDAAPVVRVPLMDAPRYLAYLRDRFGRPIVQREIRTFAEIEADVVVNCTGFGARELCGDAALHAGHGVSLVTRPQRIDRAVVRSEPLTYVIPRPDDCILGGYDAPVPASEDDVAAILPRCRDLVPGIDGTIVAVRYGIRPLRHAVRLERDGRVIHNYGHGGAGFTLSWGCAFRVRNLC
jgi:D-amino-acid oxidase